MSLLFNVLNHLFIIHLALLICIPVNFIQGSPSNEDVKTSFMLFKVHFNDFESSFRAKQNGIFFKSYKVSKTYFTLDRGIFGLNWLTT